MNTEEVKLETVDESMEATQEESAVEVDDELIGQNTVNTVPPDTLEALCDHGVPLPRLAGTESQGAQQMRKLESASIDMTAITDRLLQQGMMAFSKSYDLALESIQSKMLKIRSQ